MSVTRQVHLIPLELTARQTPAGAAPLNPLILPGGVSRLDPVAPGLAERLAPGHLLLEPVQTSTRSACLLLLAPPGSHLPLVNGQSALAPVVLLHERDEFTPIGSPYTFYVALFNQGYVGPPPADCIGRPCPICRFNIASGSRVQLCPHCSTALHLEPGDPSTSLRCAAPLVNCPSCWRPLAVEAGYTSLPPV